MSLSRIAAPLCWLLCVLAAGAAGSAEPRGRMSFRGYGTDVGIETQDISWIVQDGEGFVWACAADAVYRFDGGRFERFDSEFGLPSTQVSDVTLDAQGQLLVVTRGGVVRWDGARFAPVPMPSGARVWSVRVEPTGRMWVATEQGLYVGMAGHFIEEPGWPRGPARMLARDATGALQVASESLLGTRDARGQWRLFSLPGRPNTINALARDGQGRLWVSAEGWLAMQPADGGAPRDRSALLRELPGAGLRLHVGCRGQLQVPSASGLLEIEGEQVTLLEPSLSERVTRMLDILEDRDGTLWVAGVGVHRALGRGLWSLHDVSTGLPSSIVWGLARGRDGRLWVGTDKGLAHATADRWVPTPGLEGYSLKALVVDSDGAVWSAGRPSGLHRYEPWSGRLRTFGEESGYQANHTLGLLREPDGTMWAATTSGLLRGAATDGRWSFQKVLPVRPGMAFVGVGRDAAGRLWVTGDGLLVRERGVFRRFGREAGLRDEHLTFLLIRRDGRICVAYDEPLGLSCFTYRDGRLADLEHIYRGTGLHSNLIYQLGEDTAGRLWIGTGAGVHVLGRDGTLEHFGASGGAPGDDFNGNSFLADADGTVWTGTTMGLGRFEGARYTGSVRPRVLLLDTELGERAWRRPSPGPLESEPGETTLKVRFASLGFLDEGDLEHQTRLVGLDDWHAVMGRQVRYSALPPGDYRFELRARNGQGPWSATEGFAVHVPTPWWGSAWARGLGLVLLGVLGLGLHRWRGHALRRRNADLERLVEARTAELAHEREKVAQAEKLSAMGQLMARLSHEINNPLTAIHNNLPPVREYFEQQADFLRACRERWKHLPEAEELERRWSESQLDFVLQDTPDALETMRFATERIRSIQADLRAFLRGERPRLEEGDLNHTVRDTVEFVRRSLPSGLRVDVECGDVPRFAFHAGQLGQVLLNLLRNATDALGEDGHVLVHTRLRDGQVELVVADDGPGIPPGLRSRIFEPFFTTKDVGRGSGLGLAICRQIIAENHQGTLELDDSVPRGACFRIRLPLGWHDEAAPRAAS
jgi:signal transduction histidine kinase/ligand-binding sensor domain-containing protein